MEYIKGDYPSETAKVRALVLPYIAGLKGIDVGWGGDAITQDAILIDRHGRDRGIKADADNLPFLGDESQDYVYSSHCLEDNLNYLAILNEWLRVLKPGGLLILNLPDQNKFLEYCKLYGGDNPEHKLPELSLKWMVGVLMFNFPSLELLFTWEMEQDYTFLVVARKARA